MSSPATARPRSISTTRTVLVALVAVFALLAAACGGDDDATATSGVGSGSDAAVADVAPTAGGGQIDFGDLEGSPAMLWFWAPW